MLYLRVSLLFAFAVEMEQMTSWCPQNPPDVDMGDLILYKYNDYLSELDSIFQSQRQMCQEQKIRTVRTRQSWERAEDHFRDF